MYMENLTVLDSNLLIPKHDCPQWFRDLIVEILSTDQADTVRTSEHR